MKQTPSLDDLVLFLAVADSGGLAGAARGTGVSVPTLSRRMAALETQMALKLFVRGPKGYSLTAAGRSLLQDCEDLRGISARLSALQDTTRPASVRITAGHWTSRFLARHIHQFWSASDLWVPEFLATDVAVDVARREADIGIRNRRPDQPWLAGQRTAIITFAPFAQRGDRSGWIALPEEAATSPSQRWIYANHREQITTIANTPRLALDLARSGLGQVVLPRFAAEGTELVQTGPEIDDLAHEEWLVSHHDARHDPPIRAALNAIADLLRDRSERPMLSA
ncbi:MAG: LysR family transcriptional regulator [Pseudomonadota bacterium]